jgi:hypothetical protein
LVALETKRPFVPGDRVRDALDIAHPEHLSCGDVDEVRVGGLDLVDVGLDPLHVVQIFDRTLFAHGDNQTLLAQAQGNFRLARLEFARSLGASTGFFAPGAARIWTSGSAFARKEALEEDSQPQPPPP